MTSTQPILSDQDLQQKLNGITNTPLRMYIALRVLRAWNSGTEGYSAIVVWTINDWIDHGMNGPIPWPSDPFFAEWALSAGFSRIRESIGFSFKVHIASERGQ